MEPIRQRVRTRTSQSNPAAGSLVAASRPKTAIAYLPSENLTSPHRRLRQRQKVQIERQAACIEKHAYDPPIIASLSGEVLVGEDTLEAYRLLGRASVPVIQLTQASPAQIAAFRLWQERWASEADWDAQNLKAELERICLLNPAWLNGTGFEMADIDLALHAGGMAIVEEEPEALNALQPLPIVSRRGDLFQWKGGHRLLCGSAREEADIRRLMGGETADLLAGDPPYGVAVKLISGHHKEFLEGSGMSADEALSFHGDFLRTALPAVSDGSLVYLFIDAKGLYALLTAMREAGLQERWLITWDKASPSQGGGLYRNQSEFIIVARHGLAKAAGKTRKAAKGRVRTTVWTVPGYAQFRPDRTEALKNHSCTKPQALLMDILLDATDIGELCYDPFCGSGSMILAGERTRRRVFGMEIDPEYVDIAVRRMFDLTGEYPIDAATSLPFDQLAVERGVSWPTQAPAAAEGRGTAHG